MRNVSKWKRKSTHFIFLKIMPFMR